MAILNQKEIISTFDEFLNENGMFHSFKSFIEERGCKMEEFGMDNE